LRSTAMTLAMAKSPPVAAPPSIPLGDRIEHIVTGGPQAWAPLLATLLHGLLSLAIGAGILVLTIWAAGWASRLAREALSRLHGRTKPDAVLQGFIASLVRYTVLVIGGI